MVVLNESKAKEELVVFIRNGDLLSIAERGVTTASQTFSGTGASQTLTLTNNNVRNIRSVNDGSAKRAYFDYTPTYGSTTTIVGTFASGTNNITVTYDYSAGMVEKVWPDFPELENVKIDDFPRIGIDFVTVNPTILGIGDPNFITNALLDLRVYHKNQKTIDSIITSAKTLLKANQKKFYYFPLVHAGTSGPLLAHKELVSKVKERSVQVLLKFAYES